MAPDTAIILQNLAEVPNEYRQLTNSINTFEKQVTLMQIKNRVSFLTEENVELTSYLSSHSIAWKKGEIVSTVEVFEDSPHWPFVHQYARERNIPILSSTVFSKSELDQSQWLHVRSQWRFGYPQPEAAFGYRAVTYADGRCEACGAGAEQIAPFRMTNPPLGESGTS